MLLYCIKSTLDYNIDLKAKVADNEFYAAKLTKEKQERSIIKKTSTVGVQFKYPIPSMGKSIIVCVTDCVIQLTVMNVIFRYPYKNYFKPDIYSFSFAYFDAFLTILLQKV